MSSLRRSGGPDELAFVLATAPALWETLAALVRPEDHALVDFPRGWPFTLPGGPADILRLDPVAVAEHGHVRFLRRWAARWGGAYDARTGELRGCYGLLLPDAVAWDTLVR